VLQLKPEFAYLHKDCVSKPPVGLRKEEPLAVDVQLAAFVSGKNVKSLGDSGIIMEVIKQGTGWETPRVPFDVSVHVVARSVATDGTPQAGSVYFDSRIDSATVSGSSGEISCGLGDGTLPPGLEKAISELQIGEEAIVWCPVALATSNMRKNKSTNAAAASSPFVFPAPPSQESLGIGGNLYPSLRYIEFTVSLLDFSQVRDLTGDGGAVKRILKKGRGDFPADCPLEDTKVTAKIRVRPALYKSNTDTENTMINSNMTPNSNWVPLPGSTDDTGSIEIDLGMGQIPTPVEAGIRLMLRGELATVLSTWAHSYGNKDDVHVLDKTSKTSNIDGNTIPECLSHSSGGVSAAPDVEFEVEMIDFKPIPNVFSLTTAEKLKRSSAWREQGNFLYKSGRYKLAKSKYMQGIKSVDQIHGVDSEEQAVEAKKAKVSCLLNLAACAQKEKEYGEVIKWCDKAIE